MDRCSGRSVARLKLPKQTWLGDVQRLGGLNLWRAAPRTGHDPRAPPWHCADREEETLTENDEFVDADANKPRAAAGTEKDPKNKTADDEPAPPGGLDPVEEAGIELFPASDPPSWMP